MSKIGGPLGGCCVNAVWQNGQAVR